MNRRDFNKTLLGGLAIASAPLAAKGDGVELNTISHPEPNRLYWTHPISLESIVKDVERVIQPVNVYDEDWWSSRGYKTHSPLTLSLGYAGERNSEEGKIKLMQYIQTSLMSHALRGRDNNERILWRVKPKFYFEGEEGHLAITTRFAIV